MADTKKLQFYAQFLKKHLDFRDGDAIMYNLSELRRILADVKVLFKNEPTLLEVPAPCIIVGDIHGQYEDLHRMFTMTGKGNKSGAICRRYLFLGDYVDRGAFSLECISCLFVYKLIFPRMFNLLRGNHELALINQNYGFLEELRDRFPGEEGTTLWTEFNAVFDLLPLAAVVQGRLLCMHGGISPHLNSLDDIRKIKRPLSTMEESALACDLLWADPALNFSGFARNIVRGAGVCFGEDAVLNVCQKLHIDLIVRAHQMMLNGFGFFCKRRLVTVFTAPRYDAEKNNKGAVMTVTKDLKIGFMLLCPATAIDKGHDAFMRSYMVMSDEPGHISSEDLSDEQRIKTFDPSEVYNAEAMRKSLRIELKPPPPRKQTLKNKSISLRVKAHAKE